LSPSYYHVLLVAVDDDDDHPLTAFARHALRLLVALLTLHGSIIKNWGIKRIGISPDLCCRIVTSFTPTLSLLPFTLSALHIVTRIHISASVGVIASPASSTVKRDDEQGNVTVSFHLTG
jgi:hypothetical protein